MSGRGLLTGKPLTWDFTVFVFLFLSNGSYMYGDMAAILCSVLQIFFTLFLKTESFGTRRDIESVSLEPIPIVILH